MYWFLVLKQGILHFYHTKINLSNTEIIFRLILVVKFRFSPISAASIFRIRSKFWPRSGPIFALILIFSLQWRRRRRPDFRRSGWTESRPGEQNQDRLHTSRKFGHKIRQFVWQTRQVSQTTFNEAKSTIVQIVLYLVFSL